MYCFNQSNYREPVKVPSECDPCCANKPDFLSKVGLATDCKEYDSVPMATCCMTNKEIHFSLQQNDSCQEKVGFIFGISSTSLIHKERTCLCVCVCVFACGRRNYRNEFLNVDTHTPLTLSALLYMYRARNNVTQLSVPTHAQLQCY